MLFESKQMHHQDFIHQKNANYLNQLTMQSRIMSDEENRLGKKSDWYRLNLNGPVRNFPKGICNLTYITTLVIKSNNLERLPQEIGKLINLVVIDASQNKIKELPTSIGNLVLLRALILNENRIEDLPSEFGFLLHLRHLNLQYNPIRQQLSSLYNDGSEMAVRRVVRHYMDLYYLFHVQTAPRPRNWRVLEKPSAEGYAFTLISYNVLSPNYATQTQYPYCPTFAMDWDYRRRCILDELRNYNASIVCLQELDTNQFEEVFKPQLSDPGYDGVFIPKSRSRTMDPGECKKVDGCAIFWKREYFDKVCEFHHEFMLSCSNVSEQPAPLIVNRVMTRDNVALGVVFETKTTPQPQQFCVTTGHIHWDPEHSDVKVIQSIMWTAELWAYLDAFFAQNMASKENRGATKLCHDIGSSNNPLVTGKPMDNSPAARMPVIMCGDFNSLPNSGVVEFLLNGRLNKKHAEFLDYGFKYMFEDWKMLEKWAVDGDILRHRFDFDRAHRENQGVTFTNYTYDFKGMIDYVFFTKRHIRLLGSLDQVPESWFQENRVMGCPHVHMPSDHFPLLVELELLPETEGDSSSSSGVAAVDESAQNSSGRPQKQGGGGNSSSAPNSTNKQSNAASANKRAAGNGNLNDGPSTPGPKFGASGVARNANSGAGKQMRYNNSSTSDKK